VKLKRASHKLEHLQRLSCLLITDALRTSTTNPLEITVDLLPLPNSNACLSSLTG